MQQPAISITEVLSNDLQTQTLIWLAPPIRENLRTIFKTTRLGYCDLYSCLLLLDNGMAIGDVVRRTRISPTNGLYAPQLIEFTKQMLEDLLTPSNEPQKVCISITRQSQGRDGDILSLSVDQQHNQAVTLASSLDCSITHHIDIKQKIGGKQDRPLGSFNKAVIFMMRFLSAVAEANENKYPAREHEEMPKHQIFTNAYAFAAVAILGNQEFFELLGEIHCNVHLYVMYPGGYNVLKGTKNFPENIAQNVTSSRNIDAHNAKIISSIMFRYAALAVIEGRRTDPETEEQKFRKKYPDVLKCNKNEHTVRITKTSRRYITGYYPVYDVLNEVSEVKFRVTTKTSDSNFVNGTSWKMMRNRRWVSWR